jgi:hypothetical protein
MESGVHRVKRECAAAGESQLNWRLRMTYRFAFPLLALLVAGGCSAKDATAPISPGAASAERGVNDQGGILHAIKNCIGTYNGAAKDFCTITQSNVKQIKLGSTVVYQTAAGAAGLNSDVIMYPPHSGDNLVFGHCALDFATGIGHCDFTGGTGKFEGFRASVTVTCNAGICALDGPYSFSKNGDED